ncbi:MAG: SAM-dependent methyltransferase [Rhodospirillaceae bacterium]|jgi:SAM-dependent methyltransferase|nr:SAM-dependent methyltransferase [Rhodospirillaceae bacterium]|tara:strand:- start:845 stop:1507 length:663 start_codon:yes stop_codon:yes gene_type:complete
MQNIHHPDLRSRHLRITEPSPWVRRFAPLIPPGGGNGGDKGGAVLDLAAGGGRHGRYLLGLGFSVVLVDRNIAPLADLAGEPRAEIIEADMETGAAVFAPGGPLAGRTFAGIVVVNYLHRPLVEDIVAALAPGGVLIYETFASGNERFQRPRNPDHLLKSGELLDLLRDRLQIVAYEHGLDETAEIPGVKQRVCAVNDLDASDRDDGEPGPHPVAPEQEK